MKQKFNVITSTYVPLPLENVDTDQIIPARYLKLTQKDGFGPYLFHDWRFNADGSEKKDFVLNNPDFKDAVLGHRLFTHGGVQCHKTVSDYQVLNSLQPRILDHNRVVNLVAGDKESIHR